MPDQMTFGGPYLQVAAICEKVLSESDGALSLIRMVDRFTVAGQAPEMTPTPFSFTIFLAFKAGHFRGKATVIITPTTPTGLQGQGLTLPVLFEGDDERGVVLRANMNMLIVEDGRHWFDVSILDSVVTRIPMMVVYQQTRIGPHHELL